MAWNLRSRGLTAIWRLRLEPQPAAILQAHGGGFRTDHWI